MRIPGILLLCATLIYLAGCSKKDNGPGERPLARVYDRYLYAGELAGVVPEGTSSADSADMITNYIQQWVKQQLIVVQAENNLQSAEKDFSLELEKYRNSLVVYKYESRLVREKLDTVVSEQEIETYYRDNPGDFELRDNIVRVVYIKLRKSDPNLNRVRNLVRSNREDDKDELLRLSASIAVNSFLDDQVWLIFNDLLKEIPINTYNQEEYLRNHRFVEFSDKEVVYLVNFIDFRIKEGLSPLSLERDNIRNIIVNKRKLRLISEMEKEVYDKALANKEFEIF
ncbi:MAG TPA: hypothetical protein P5531_05885 [Bacteroidales bacterium]|nr:hypothetical protein [Bacteroidales bacterium]HSA42938.1 hypothetical protein [Bacteroidales bacterium]